MGNRAERIFQLDEPTLSSRVELISGKVPFHWHQHPMIQRTIDIQIGDIIDEGPNCLEHDCLPELMPELLAQTEIIEPTLLSLFPHQEAKITALHGLHFQAGKKAYILLCQAETTAGPGHFIMYLSKGPEGSSLADETKDDFVNLRTLSQVAESKLTGPARKKYRFVKPIALGVSPKVSGLRYPFFTTPFIADCGELRAYIYRDPETRITMVSFAFALPYNQTMQEYNNRASKSGPQIKERFKNLRKKFPHRNIPEITRILKNSSPSKRLRKQMKDLLTGNALIYLLSGGHFPKEFYVNAGDWMMRPTKNDRLYLFLTTIRGGWEFLKNDDLWIERMKNHKEPVPGMEHRNMFFPLFYGSTDLISQSLERAKGMIS